MDISKPPDASELKAASGIWQWLLFFGGLVFSGGAIEFWLNRRYVTKKELQTFQASCQRHIMDQLEIALLKKQRPS
jgi:hypothetical protein